MSTKTVSREEEDIENCILFITTAPRMSSITRSITSRPTLTRTVFRDSTEEVATLKTAEIADTLATSLATLPSPEVNSDLEELETLAGLAKLCLEARDVQREDQEVSISLRALWKRSTHRRCESQIQHSAGCRHQGNGPENAQAQLQTLELRPQGRQRSSSQTHPRGKARMDHCVTPMHGIQYPQHQLQLSKNEARGD